MNIKYAYSLKTTRVRETDFPYKDNEAMSSNDVAKEFFATLDNFDVEHFAVAYLDVKNKLVSVWINQGTIDQTAVYPREVVKHAILSGAAKCIIAHNHPSGDTTPSRSDRELTKILNEALSLMQIKLLDHIIIGSPGNTYSFSENGFL